MTCSRMLLERHGDDSETPMVAPSCGQLKNRKYLKQTLACTLPSSPMGALGINDGATRYDWTKKYVNIINIYQPKVYHAFVTRITPVPLSFANHAAFHKSRSLSFSPESQHLDRNLHSPLSRVRCTLYAFSASSIDGAPCDQSTLQGRDR